MNKIHFRVEEQINFMRRLSFLLGANIPILKGLNMISGNTSNVRGNRQKRYRIQIQKIIQKLEQGKSLGRILEEEKILNPMALCLIQAGEESGNLVNSLESAATELEKRKEAKQNIINSLLYPAIIFFLSIGMTTFLVGFVFPKVLPLLSSFGSKLPLPTRILLESNHLIKSYGILAALVLILSVLILRWSWSRSNKLRYYFQKNILKLPLIRTYVIDRQLVSLSHYLELFLKNNFSLSFSLRLMARNIQNLFIKETYELTWAEIEKGRELHQAFKDSKFAYPFLFLEMVEIAEKSGQLPEIFSRLGNHYSKQFDSKLKKMTSIIEPAMMIFTGIIVTLVALSIVLPIYNLTSSINR